MRKKVMVTFIVFLVLLFSIQFSIAEENESGGDIVVEEDEEINDLSKIDKGYEWLRNEIDEKGCSKLTLGENIFTTLATGKCESELISRSDGEKCWPDGNCNVKSTSQAAFALNRLGKETADAEEWILEQSKEAENVDWYLQIDQKGKSEEMNCDIEYSGSTSSLTVNKDKTLSSGAGSCLYLANNDYWLGISSECLDEEFEISCDRSFLTSLIFKQSDSSTYHISGEANSADSQGTTTEKVDSLCFTNSGSCSYEGSLWATLVVYNDENMDSYIPYLTVEAEEYPRYLPDSFLYLLTSSDDYFNSLLLKQRENQYWQVSGDQFYDTGVALLGLYNSDAKEKQNAKEWLLNIQNDKGYWDNGNLLTNSLLLYAGWKRDVSSNDPEPNGELDCEESGYYCSSLSKCNEIGGNQLEDYSCMGASICCSEEETLESCSSQEGEICSYDEECTGIEKDASDISGDGVCCVEGSCEEKTDDGPSECEINNGNCRDSCLSGEEIEYSYSCGSGNCCIEEKEEGGSYWWIWVLIILILLVVIAIIFREKLKELYFKTKSKFDKSGGRGGRKGPSGRGPPGRPGSPGSPMNRPPQNFQGRNPSQGRVIPRQRPRGPQPKRPKQSGEFNSVLKKLKDMGK